ncbi:hypothetical protein [Rhizobium tubonense]|uniref:Uncharacterized protein n=1 Tax=Rhizobium tubonense TaxID=484088 RepID=A0A2W4C9I3_9HYPH|nr:hypothetical protein [Rhizobium tubonense]PZM10052.1 hypothetical protein CPY51_24125 [Rhizobium tubonense]
MRLIDTRVGNINVGMTTVDFRGEADEHISVTMATDGSLDEAALVMRAKAIMMQLTAFQGDGDTPQVTPEQSEELEDERIEGLPDTDPEVPAAFGLKEPASSGSVS